MSLAHLSIGTADSRINLLDKHGFHQNGWVPQAEPADDTFSESALADYRQLTNYRELTAVETIPLVLRSTDQDDVIRRTQQLRRMLGQARDYWASKVQPLPVYLQARASCETNMRYAIVHTGAVPQDANPYQQPFGSARPVMPELNLIVERGPWTDTVPGDGTVCVQVSGESAAGHPYYLDFDGVGDEVNCGSDASIDDLPLADFTAEAWVRADGLGGSNEGTIFDKADKWHLGIYSTGSLDVWARYTVTNAKSRSLAGAFGANGEWRHVVAAWDQSAATWYLAIDGVWCATYDMQTAGGGAYVSDAGGNLYIGNNTGTSQGWDGGIGWCRISTGLRYTIGTNFTPPERCVFPADTYAV